MVMSISSNESINNQKHSQEIMVKDKNIPVHIQKASKLYWIGMPYQMEMNLRSYHKYSDICISRLDKSIGMLGIKIINIFGSSITDNGIIISQALADFLNVKNKDVVTIIRLKNPKREFQDMCKKNYPRNIPDWIDAAPGGYSWKSITKNIYGIVINIIDRKEDGPTIHLTAMFLDNLNKKINDQIEVTTENKTMEVTLKSTHNKYNKGCGITINRHVAESLNVTMGSYIVFIYKKKLKN